MNEWTGVFILGLIIYLFLRYPLRYMSLAFKVVFVFIVGIIGLMVLFAILSYHATGLKGPY